MSMALAIRVHEAPDSLPVDAFREDVLAGLAASPKAIPPKHFYDRRGSELFEQICAQPEYYLTRTEEALLHAAAGEIARLAGPGACLLELGSGASRKVRLLLGPLRPSRYLGIDISRDFLLASTRRLAAEHPWLEVHALCADFSHPLQLPAELQDSRPLLFFPGSSIGNFTPGEARRFLRNLHGLLPEGGDLLIGVDLLKDVRMLEAAYNDAAGVTAAFNLNLLERIRRELDCDLEPARFHHLAFFNEALGRIEMHLQSHRPQQVRIEDRVIEFAEGETLRSEISCKYSVADFQALAASAGFAAEAVWTDPHQWFSLHYLRRQPPARLLK